MRSDNLQLPSVRPPTSSYNFQPPHGRHGHHGCHSHGSHVGRGERHNTTRQNRHLTTVSEHM